MCMTRRPHMHTACQVPCGGRTCTACLVSSIDSLMRSPQRLNLASALSPSRSASSLVRFQKLHSNRHLGKPAR